MFTGIVEELGAVRSLEEGRLVVGCRVVVTDSTLGASVAVNGTCLTVVERDDDTPRRSTSATRPWTAPPSAPCVRATRSISSGR